MSSDDRFRPQFLPSRPTAPVAVLSPEGELVDGYESSLAPEELLRALELMWASRIFDDRAIKLQRQGRFGTFAPGKGQEATVVGSSFALDPVRDWVIPQYREVPAMVHQGMPLQSIAAYFMGKRDGARIPENVNVLPIQISLAAQIPHAVGLAWGLAKQQRDGVVCVYFGDGASSEGDFHEAANLAGVVGAPVVFLLQNNGWAISTPVTDQTAAADLASRAVGYGFQGVVVDGNDFLAVYEVTRRAVQRGRNGQGPTLIEARTFRMGPHTTADDPTKYVQEASIEHWRRLDPIERLERYLIRTQAVDEMTLESVREKATATVEGALAAALALPHPTEAELSEHVFADGPPRSVIGSQGVG